MVDLSTPSHSSTRVAKGAGVSPATLRGYYARGKFRPLKVGNKDVRELADKGGQPHVYNARGAMHVALAVELVRYGLDGEAAFNAALAILIGDADREPGGCYHPNEFGETYFCYSRDTSPPARICTEDEFKAQYLAYDRPGSFLTISLTQLEARVFAALGIEGHSWDNWGKGEGLA